MGHPSNDLYAYYDTIDDLKQDLKSLEDYWKDKEMPEWAEEKKKFLEDGIKTNFMSCTTLSPYQT
jgi:hypothetical protein